MSDILLVVAVAAAIWGVASMVLITAALQKRGFKINYIFLKVLIVKYIGQYRAVTVAETGHPGPLFYHFVVAMNLALASGILGALLRGT